MIEVQLQHDRMAGDLLSALIDEIRLIPKPWPSLPEVEQAEVIERLRARVTSNVREAVRSIASTGRVSVAAKVESMALKDACKLLLTVDGTREKHDLLDALGTNVVIVLCDMESYLGGLGDVKPDDEQRTLDLDRATGEIIQRAKRDSDGLL